jgi:hypothetical protein
MENQNPRSHAAKNHTRTHGRMEKRRGRKRNHRTGTVPTTKEEYVDAIEKRKGFWMDWRQMKAVAAGNWNGMGVTIIIFEWTAGEWKKRATIKAKAGKTITIAPLCIWGSGNDRHAVLATPAEGQSYPEAWTSGALSQDWKGRAGGQDEGLLTPRKRTSTPTVKNSPAYCHLPWLDSPAPASAKSSKGSRASKQANYCHLAWLDSPAPSSAKKSSTTKKSTPMSAKTKKNTPERTQQSSSSSSSQGNSAKKNKEGTMDKPKEIAWKCPFGCGKEIKHWSKTKIAIDARNHLQQRHDEEAKKQVRNNLKWRKKSHQASKTPSLTQSSQKCWNQ